MKKISESKLIFAGNGNFAAQALKVLAEKKFPFDLVISASDRKSGRGRQLTELPVKSVCLTTNYRLKQFNELGEFSEILDHEKPDCVTVADFGLIIRAQDLTKPKLGFLNIHPSLLPKYRGASPIQSAILAGDQKTGVTIIRLDDQIDHGSMLAQKSLPIRSDETTLSLTKKLAELGAEMLEENIEKFLNGQADLIEQDHHQATMTKIIKKEAGKIDWQKPAELIDRQVRAMLPWPKAYTFFQGKRLIILEGKIAGHRYLPTKVQLEGRKTISWQEFLRGQHLRDGIDVWQTSLIS